MNWQQMYYFYLESAVYFVLIINKCNTFYSDINFV